MFLSHRIKFVIVGGALYIDSQNYIRYEREAVELVLRAAIEGRVGGSKTRKWLAAEAHDLKD